MPAFCVKAQTNNFVISFTAAKVKSNMNGTVEALVQIKNTTNKPLQGVFNVWSDNPELYLVQRKPKTLKLMANDSVVVIIKAIVSNKASPDSAIVLKANFTDFDTKAEQSATLAVQIQEKKSVRMALSLTNLFYEHLGDSIQIPIRILNDGNSSQQVILFARYADLAENEIKKMSMEVKPFSDTLLVVKKLVTRAILAQENFSIAITALYKNGDIIGITNVEANPIKQSRRYISPYLVQTDHAMNQFTVTKQSEGKNNNMYAIYANLQALTNKGSFYANLDANWWEKSNQLLMRNTWLGYKGENFGLKLGNVAKFNELNFIGRGLEASYKVTEKSTIEAGILDKAYAVLDFSAPSSGQSGWLSFIGNGGSEKGLQASLLYDNNTYEKTQRTVATSKAALMCKPNFFLQLAPAISRVSALENSENKWGAATELNFHGKTDRLFYSSSNYISSAYFAGIRSGALNLYESVRYNLKKYELLVGVNHFSFAPKVLKSTSYQPSTFSNTQLSLGVARRFPAAVFSLLLFSVAEKRTQPLFLSEFTQSYQMQANRINLSVNYFKGNQNINLAAEGGLFKSNFSTKQQFQFKANFNYNWKFLNLMGYYQHNTFDIGEITAAQQTTKPYFNLIVAPSVQTQFLRQKLRIEAGLMYTKNSFVAKSLQLNSRIDFNWNKNLTLFANNFYSDFSNDFKPINSIQFGITKRFNPIQIDKSKSDLELFLFYDLISNGTLDAQILPCPHQLVTINGKAFRTNEKGIIKYKNLPKGEYEIRVINSSEWYAPPQQITIEKSLKMYVGLVKTAIIRGDVKYLSTATAFDINQKLAGLSLSLTDESGKVFYTKTDEAGKFVFYVPQNKYTLTLSPSDISEHVNIVANNIVVNATIDTIQQISFILQVKEKRIEVKKFGAKPY